MPVQKILLVAGSKIRQMTSNSHRFNSRLRFVTLHHSLRWLIPALLLVAFVAIGCYNSKTGEANIGGKINFTLPAFPDSGAHRVEIFTEMHFSPAYRVQEGPRILPPPDSVPITGKEPKYDSLDEYGALVMPGDVRRSYDFSAAKELFRINCLVCHGASLRGDGPITNPVYNYSGASLPKDLTASDTQSSSDGELYAFIALGGREGSSFRIRGRESSSPMPEFRLLLTVAERWSLVQFLRNPSGN